MISIISINYRNAHDTLALLRSLTSQSSGSWDVIIVDNDSGETERALLGEFVATGNLPVHLLLNEKNTGFSGGNNIGIRKALSGGADWIVLLNNDCVVPEGWVAELRTGLSGAPPGVYALPISEGERTAWCGIIRWFSASLAHARSHDIAVDALQSGIGYAIGAALVVHRSVLETVGPLDERYFLYFEDAEYSARVRAHGYAIRLLEVPPVAHKVSASTSSLGGPLLLRYHARNALLFNQTHGPWWVRFSLPFLAFSRILTQALKMVLIPSRRAASRAIALGIIDFYAKRFGKISDGHRPGM